MNKKNLALIICAVFVVIALVVSLVFIFGGEEPKESETGEPEEAFSLKGTWLVVANYTNDTPVFTDGQFMTFTDTRAAMYKDASGDAYAESGYVVNEANQLVLSDISRQYKIDRKTDNCVRLYDTAQTYMLLIRNGKEERQVEAITAQGLAGRWNVALKGDVFNNGEVMEFEGNSLKYYRDASSDPFKTADFTVEGNKIVISALGLNMRCYKISADRMVFVEDSGIVWELSK